MEAVAETKAHVVSKSIPERTTTIVNCLCIFVAIDER